MQDRRVRFGDANCPPPFPRRTQKHERHMIRFYRHRDSAAAAGSDNRSGLMTVELSLRKSDCGLEIVIRKRRINNLVTVSNEMSRLHAAWNGVPSVEKKNFHSSEHRRQPHSTTKWNISSWSAIVKGSGRAGDLCPASASIPPRLCKLVR